MWDIWKKKSVKKYELLEFVCDSIGLCSDYFRSVFNGNIFIGLTFEFGYQFVGGSVFIYSRTGNFNSRYTKNSHCFLEGVRDVVSRSLLWLQNYHLICSFICIILNTSCLWASYCGLKNIQFLQLQFVFSIHCLCSKCTKLLTICVIINVPVHRFRIMFLWQVKVMLFSTPYLPTHLPQSILSSLNSMEILILVGYTEFDH